VFSNGAQYSRVNCWAHTMRNINKKMITLVKNKEDETSIRDDLHYVQLAANKKIFMKSFQLFQVKWLNYNEFMMYIETNWVNKSSGWYEGAAPGCPSTDNSLESVNNTIKRENTLRKKLPCAEFMKNLISIVQEWSLDRNSDSSSPNKKSFASVPRLSTQVLDKAYKWQVAAVGLKSREKSGGQMEFFIGAKNKHFTGGDIKEYEELRINLGWKSFSEYVEKNFGIWKMEFSSHSWEDSKCSCPVFQKEYICKHNVGVAIRQKWLNVPEEISSLPLGQKRSRGRSKKNSFALSRE